jgi:hypothetical protein
MKLIGQIERTEAKGTTVAEAIKEIPVAIATKEALGVEQASEEALGVEDHVTDHATRDAISARNPAAGQQNIPLRSVDELTIPLNNTHSTRMPHESIIRAS